MRTGGTAKSIRILTIAVVVISLFLIGLYINQKKQNYTELWDKVNNCRCLVK